MSTDTTTTTPEPLFYRYVDATRLMHGKPLKPTLRVFQRVRLTASYHVVRELPGDFTGHDFNPSADRRISRTAKHPYAHQDKQEAARHYLARKAMQAKHLERKLQTAKGRLLEAERYFNMKTPELHLVSRALGLADRYDYYA